MVSEYAETNFHDNVADQHLVYHLQQHQADSEESFLGLGITENNQKTWYAFKSDKPEVKRNYQD